MHTKLKLPKDIVQPLQDPNSQFTKPFYLHNVVDYETNTQVDGAQIATTAANYDEYVLVPHDGTVREIVFNGASNLATSDTNYITWTVINYGQDGTGSTAMLSTADTNTTKTTGGSALTAQVSRSLILSTTLANLDVIRGDRLRFRAAVSGTLANTVDLPLYMITIVV